MYKTYALITDQNNQSGLIETSQLVDQRPGLVIQLFDGQEVRIGSSEIELLAEGVYRFAGSFNSVGQVASAAAALEQNGTEAIKVPVIAEEVQIDKRWIETGRVRLNRVVHDEETTINELLAQEEIEIERVPVDEIVEAVPPVRYEGETLIIPRIEEELVITKRFRLKEEIHVVKRTVEKPVSQPVILQKQAVEIERLETAPGDDA